MPADPADTRYSRYIYIYPHSVRTLKEKSRARTHFKLI